MVEGGRNCDSLNCNILFPSRSINLRPVIIIGYTLNVAIALCRICAATVQYRDVKPPFPAVAGIRFLSQLRVDFPSVLPDFAGPSSRLDIVEVEGSSPLPPTIYFRGLRIIPFSPPLYCAVYVPLAAHSGREASRLCLHGHI